MEIFKKINLTYKMFNVRERMSWAMHVLIFKSISLKMTFISEFQMPEMATFHDIPMYHQAILCFILRKS